MGRIVLALVLGWALWWRPATAQAQAETRFFNGAGQHQRILAQRMDETIQVQVAAEIFGGANGVLATAGVVVGVIEWQHDRPMAATWIAGFGTVTGFTISSLFMTRDTRSSVLEGVIFGSPFVAALGFAIADDPGRFPRLTTASMAAGYAASGTLTVINRALTATPYRVLRTHRARLDEPRSLSDTERRTMHLALLGARGPVPRWLIGMPMLIAGGVALGPAFDDGYGKDAHLIAGLGGTLQLLTGLSYLFPGSVTRYENDLKTFDISIAAAPGGAMLSGIF